MVLVKNEYIIEEETCSKEEWQTNLIPNSWPGNCFGCSPSNDKSLKMKISAKGNK